jgi:Tfp pilus assembly protein PilO
MNRQVTLLVAVGLVLLVVVFYLFGWKPKSDEIAEIRAQTDDAVAQQALLESQIASLEDVRANAPEIEAALATAESLVPRDAALPSALRQLQLAADDSGTVLVSIAAGRPAAVEDVPELARVAVTITAEGSYFQLVDFLRRIEDPSITPRVVLFENVALSVDEHPTLTAALTGSMFAILPAPPAAEPAPEPEPTETEADVDVDVEVDEEAAA